MIKNVVFDFGQVLVRFDPLYMVKKHVAQENDARLIAEVLFELCSHVVKHVGYVVEI